MTATQHVAVTVVTAPACHFCEDAEQALAELAQVWPLDVRVVDAGSADGQSLVSAYRAGMFPLVLVNGTFFSAGRLPRRKLARLLARRSGVLTGVR